MPLCGWRRKKGKKISSLSPTAAATTSSTTSTTTPSNGHASTLADQPKFEHSTPGDVAEPTDAGSADSTKFNGKAVTTSVVAHGDASVAAPAMTVTSAIEYGNPRNKCALQPGHSLMDWIRLGNSGTDLAGNRGVPRPIALSELAKHCTPDDAWMAVHGKCYNVTRYMNFHPGGCDELMRGVGKDATRLFDEVHAWVNYEQMLTKCYLGPLRSPGNFATAGVNSGARTSAASLSFASSEFKLPLQALAPASTHTSPTRSSLTVAAEAARRAASVDKCASLPASPTESPTAGEVSAAVLASSEDEPEIVPRFDWMQKSGDLMLVFYTRALCNPGWSVQAHKEDTRKVTVRVFAQRSVHLFEFVFLHAVRWPCTNKVSFDTGKIELIFKKDVAQLWTSFGILDRRKVTDLNEITTFVYDVSAREEITPDSCALLLKPRDQVIQYVPVGYHLRIATSGLGGVERSYTPVPMAFMPSVMRQADDASLPLLVKSYPKGALSCYMARKEPLAESLSVSQPRGAFSLYKTRLHTRVAMLAAGSGLTPMLSVLDYMLERTSNKMESITLLYFNKLESDIWCRKYLEELSLKDKRFRVVNYLSGTPTPSDWPASHTGRISADIVAPLTNKTSPTYSTYTFVCGPPKFNDECKRLLATVGLDASKVHVFH